MQNRRLSVDFTGNIANQLAVFHNLALLILKHLR
jgi:hypothetical protein